MGYRLFMVPPSVLLTDHRPHGDGLVAFGFIRELAARGHELHVAAGGVDLRERVPPNVHIHVLAGPRGDSAIVARLRFMSRLRRLYRRLTSEAPLDLVHQLTPVEVGVTLALADLSVPVVLGPYVPDWVAGEDAATVQSPVARRARKALRAAQQLRATTVLVSNPAAATKVASWAGRRLHVRELPLGIDERAWLPAAGDGAGQDVLFMANLDVRKGIYDALDAFARLASRLPDARLMVAGAGREAEEVRRRVRTSPALERVELLGHVERRRALATMQACDVYCLPSYGDPHPLSVLEAMACARPVVATDAGGLRYVVPDDGGRKVRPGDPVGLASALEEVLTNPALRREMGAHNRRVVEERYAWSRIVDRLEDLYREAVSRPRRSA
jgi:glycosyltransferase involved in cell wall biosynthesis